MRVISGASKGHRLFAPKGSLIRPTLDRVKEAIFNIIGNEIRDINFLDLFAGTGSIGIEALSRGASTTVFVEQNSRNVSIIYRNLKSTGFDNDKAMVFRKNVFSALKSLDKRRFEYIFLDPPYNKDYVMKTVNSIADNQLLKMGGIVIAEHGKDEIIHESTDRIILTMQRAYGDTIISFFRLCNDM